MDLKQKLLEMAREATGDSGITVAGDFQPKGLTWKVAAGAAAGSVLGDVSGSTNLDSAIGAGLGAAAGQLAGTSGQLPRVIVLAASPATLYLLTTNNGRGIIVADSLILIDSLNRASLSVELKQRVSVRTAVITDESTGHTYKIEGKRVLFHHMNDLLDALEADQDDADDDTVVAVETDSDGPV